jgi:hypothetical protein
MSIAELIMQGTNRASESTAWVGKSLADLGRNVGEALERKEQQKQAQEMLPFLQQSMQESMTLAGQGKTGEAYAKLMPFLADPSVINNPNLRQVIPAFESGIKMAGDQFYKKEQLRVREGMYNARYGGGGGGGGEEDRNLYTPEERARMTLLNKTPNVTTYPNQNVVSDTTAVSQPVSQSTAQGQIGLPATRGDLISDLEGPLPEAVPTEPMQKEGGATEMTYKGPQIKAVESMAASIKSPEYKKALLNSIKNPAPPEQVASFKQFSEQYNSLPENKKMVVMQDLSLVFDSNKNFENNKAQLGKDFYPLKPEQSDAIGNNITGIILEPVTEAKSFTAGAKSDSVTFGTTKEDIDKYQAIFTTAATELAEGKLGKFLKENGGVFNTTYTETPSKVTPTMATQGGKITIPSSVVLYQKNLDPNDKKTPLIELSEGQLSAYQTIKNSPSRLQQLRAGNSNSSFVRVEPTLATGPTRKAAKSMPLPQSKASDFLSQFPVKKK